MNKIKELFAPRCIHRHTIETHPNCFKEGKPLAHAIPNPVKMLALDIETLPILGYTWDVWNTNILPSQVKKDWCLLSYSAKWIGSDKIISDILTPEEAINRDDKRLATGIWKLLEEAPIVITHNGKRFDIKKINARFWKNGLHKPSSYKVIDTLVAAKSSFGLTYNKLDFIAKYIGLQEKLETDFELWVRCDEGVKEALQYMREYNENDVIMQQDIYLNMREWIPNHPDLSVYGKLDNVCVICLGTDYKEIGLFTAKKQQYKEYRCSSCGSVFHDTKAVEKEKVKKPVNYAAIT
jgi:RNase H-like protein